jgi:hypothetical protein
MMPRLWQVAVVVSVLVPAGLAGEEWTHFLELRMPDGKWVPSEEVTCKK